MLRVDTDWLALRAGLKPGLRLTADAAGAREIAERYQNFGCAVALARGHVGRERRPQVILYIARDAQTAVGLRAAERPLLEPHSNARDRAFFSRELGLRLGYPPCCVQAFVDHPRGGGPLHTDREPPLDTDYFAATSGWSPRPDWRINTLLMRQHARLISFTPCRLDCAAAVAQADAVLRLVREQAAASAPVLEDMLRRPLVIDPTGARAWVRPVDGRLAAASAPREPPDGPVDPADVSRAAAWLGATFDAEGHVHGFGLPSPRLLDFSAR